MEKVDWARDFLKKGRSIFEMMQVVGEEGTSTEDFTVYLKSEFLDAVYLQQNSFDEVDAACSVERQKYLFELVCSVLRHEFHLTDKDQARDLFFNLTEQFKNWNFSVWESPSMTEAEDSIKSILKDGSQTASGPVCAPGSIQNQEDAKPLNETENKAK
jgi:V/A-type H+-transporting ATPase subunit A